jgi:aspartyl-tRNA(Asn)/glutamyl-tRNA(Gln) amidotransferase subunit C
MKLARTDVIRVAELARLKLTESEIDQYREQLSEVLEYIDQLNQLDTKGTPVTAQASGQTNVLAPDVVTDSLPPAKLLKDASALQGSAIKVKAVFDDSGSGA